uniref:glutathione transferase n=2 Tax=Aedes aegypti TaxID=7159 RepID=A0A0N8ES64_AEDAE
MDLYYMPISPPCWSILLLGRQLDLTFNLKEIDFKAEEHKKPEFLKINPAHTVPTLAVGDGYALSESRAILVYLVESLKTEGQENSLYPRDAKTRGLIHNRLDFDLGTLYQRIIAYCSPQWKSGSMGTEENRTKVQDAFELLEVFLSKTKYVAADQLTIADISLFVSVSLLDLCYFDRSGYGKVAAWHDVLKKELVGYEDVIAKGFPEWRKHVTKPETN